MQTRAGGIGCLEAAFGTGVDGKGNRGVLGGCVDGRSGVAECAPRNPASKIYDGAFECGAATRKSGFSGCSSCRGDSGLSGCSSCRGDSGFSGCGGCSGFSSGVHEAHLKRPWVPPLRNVLIFVFFTIPPCQMQTAPWNVYGTEVVAVAVVVVILVVVQTIIVIFAVALAIARVIVVAVSVFTTPIVIRMIKVEVFVVMATVATLVMPVVVIVSGSEASAASEHVVVVFVVCTGVVEFLKKFVRKLSVVIKARRWRVLRSIRSFLPSTITVDFRVFGEVVELEPVLERFDAIAGWWLKVAHVDREVSLGGLLLLGQEHVLVCLYLPPHAFLLLLRVAVVQHLFESFFPTPSFPHPRLTHILVKALSGGRISFVTRFTFSFFEL